MAQINDSKILLWLSLPYISPRKQSALIRKFGSLSALWDNFGSEGKLIEETVGQKHFAELTRYHNADYLDSELDKLRESGINVITILNPRYPKLLREPEVAAPFAFYYRGNIERFSDEVCVAIVGTRACTPYGRENAHKMAMELAENGVTVVSGLATGIDSYAHAGALDVKGRTIAVLGSGIDRITPAGNAALCDRILESGGLVMSEYRPSTPASRFTFPERNRLISGLSRAVAVIEAGEKSGALITARLALEQNREVFALPGNVDSARSKGCLDLLYEGASIVRSGADILEFLSIKPRENGKKSEILLDKEEKKVYSLLEEGEKDFDELVEASGIPPSELSSMLMELELGGIVTRRGGSLFALGSHRPKIGEKQ